MALAIENRYIWDFWYIRERDGFSVFFLNCDRKYHRNDQQHHHSVVGRAKTLDFVDFFDVEPDVFHATEDSWDNTSIWTGDTVDIAGERYLFYPSRDRRERDGTVQHIGVAKAVGSSFQRLNIKISATKGFYLEHSDPRERSIQCWRDPFVFFLEDRLYILVAAKRDRSPIDHRGCIALLETDSQLSDFRHIKVLLDTDFSEVELPQIYRTEKGSLRVFFNAKTAAGRKRFVVTKAFSSITDEVTVDREICTEDFERDRYYGFRIVPERNGAICAFDEQLGIVQVFSNVRSQNLGFGRLASMKHP